MTEQYIGPFWVEQQHGTKGTYYELRRIGEGTLCSGDDVVFMHRLAELLNDREHSKDVHR